MSSIRLLCWLAGITWNIYNTLLKNTMQAIQVMSSTMSCHVMW